MVLQSYFLQLPQIPFITMLISASSKLTGNCVILPEYQTKGLVKFPTSEVLPLLVTLLTREFRVDLM